MTRRAPGRPQSHTANPPGGPAGGGERPGRGPGGVSYVKGAVVVAVAVGLGAYLLQQGSPGAAPPAASTTTTTTTTASSSTTTTAPPASTTTAPAAAPTSSVKVLVANASHTNGVAAYFTGTLSKAGWGTLTPVTALTSETTSTIYYASGDERFARTVATELGLAQSALHALGAATPVQGTTGAQLVVVVGDDLAAKATPAG